MNQLYTLIIGIVIIGALFAVVVSQAEENGKLERDNQQKQETIKQAEKDIFDLNVRLSVHQENVRKSVKEHRTREVDPDFSVDNIQRLIEEKSR